MKFTNLFKAKYIDRFDNPTTYPVWGLEYLVVVLVGFLLSFLALTEWGDKAKHLLGAIPWTLLSAAFFVGAFWCLRRFLNKEAPASWLAFVFALLGIFWVWGAWDLLANFK